VVIDTLFSRDYIKGKSLEVTGFGLAVYRALKENAPHIIDEELTRKIEDDMEKIQTGEMTKETVIQEGKDVLMEIVNEFKLHELEIGAELKSALNETEMKEKYVGKCDKCGGNLKIINFKGSNFIGCSNYPTCRNSFPLPGYSFIKPTGKVCKFDGMPIVLVIRQKGRFEMCIGRDCPSKAQWGKKKAEAEAKKAEEAKTAKEKPKAKTRKTTAKKKAKPKKTSKPRKKKPAAEKPSVES
ncbi:MAG: DNA topoisomerase, partial [Candidatus ainarchaeum sp.]|nr:DNA topoisomerase [Candidatus ainarchaeum sp.]